jgi:predicted ATPase/DNA-binding SARP family transcriptional activator
MDRLTSTQIIPTPTEDIEPLPTSFRLNLQLFGNMKVEVEGTPLPTPRLAKGFWLLAILALRGGKEVTRDWLASMLWPDSNTPLATLRRTLTDLRRTLGPAASLLISPTRQTLRLDAHACRVDVLEFDAAVKRTDIAAMERAAHLYQGPLLDACDAAWIIQERAERQATLLHLLERLATHHRHAGNNQQAIVYLRRGIALESYHESLYRMLMQTLLEQGDVAEAILVYRNLRLLLMTELNTEPSGETTEIYRQLRAQVQRHSPQETAASPVVSSVPAPHYTNRLPHLLTRLIGRESELQDIEVSLRNARLVTLTGIGGIGKTHLAVQVAWNQQDHFADGVLFVEQAALSTADRIYHAIAVSLGIREDAKQSVLTQLTEALREHELLLVLDNCEHLVDACSHLAVTLLKECPTLRILATSRQALGLTGEVILKIPPLAVPSERIDPIKPDDIGQFLAEYPAIRLFSERVSAILPAFNVTTQNLPTIIRLCADLEGIPLALELAAARVKALSVEQIRERMSDRFALLSQGNRGALPHQQTLRTMMDWSYALLSEAEQRLFRRLSVFARGWTLEAAEAVCADIEEPESRSEAQSSPLDRSMVMHRLSQLIEKSLVQSEEAPNGTRRYRLLEMVREYALEKLDLCGEQREWLRIHRDYFLTLAKQIYADRNGPGQKRYLQTIEREYDNLRVALQFCLNDAASAEEGLWLAGYIQDYWWIRGFLQEGRTQSEAILQHPKAQEATRARSFALNGAGVIAWMQGDYARAVSLMEASLSIRRMLGDKCEAAIVLGNLGAVFCEREDYARSRSYQEESLAIFREMNVRWNIACALTNLGSAALHQGDLAYARQCYEEAIALRREINDRRGVALSLCGLGQTWAEENDPAKALRFYEESLALLREIDDKTNTPITLLCMGRALRDQGDYDSACESLYECLEICRDTGDGLAATTLFGLARLYYERRDYVLATKLLNVSDGHWSQALTTYEQEERKQIIAELQERLGQSDYTLAQSQGADMGLDDVYRLLSEQGV